MNKIIIIDKITGKRIRLSRSTIFKLLYTPYLEDFTKYCWEFQRIVKEYENTPLTKYKLTKVDKRRIAIDPSYIDSLPRYTVYGFDSAVGEKYDKKARDEFYERFMEADEEIVEFINETNENYRAKIGQSL